MSDPTGCRACDGNGWTSDRGPCPTCQTEGVIDPDRCTRCHGTGVVPYCWGAIEVRCPECAGTGRYPDEPEVELPTFFPDEPMVSDPKNFMPPREWK